MSKISVVLPTYNEKDNIIPLFQAISAVLEKEGHDFEVIVSDDNSPDQTAKVVAKYAKKDKRLKLNHRKSNPGLGLSIRSGIKLATGDIIIGMDADFNHDPATIPLLIKKLKNTHLVVASRFLKGGGMADRKRYYPTLVFNNFLKLLGMPITDNTSGMYAIRRKDLLNLDIDRIYYGYGDYHLRLLYYSKQHKYKIVEVPTFYVARLSGQSKSRFASMLINYTKISLALRFKTK